MNVSYLSMVFQSISRDNCQVKPDHAICVDVKRVEVYIETARQFYRENTHLVEDYSQLPIFRH